MARWRDRDDDDPDDDDSGEWDDYGDEPWAEEADEPAVPCPYCREPIPEDVARCPYCERYVSAEDAPPPGKPWWVWACFALAFFACYVWVSKP